MVAHRQSCADARGGGFAAGHTRRPNAPAVLGKKELMKRSKQPSFLTVLVFCLRQTWTAAPTLFVCSSVATILSGFIPSASVWVHKLVIDATVGLIQNPRAVEEVPAFFRVIGLELLVLTCGDLFHVMGQYSARVLGKLLEVHLTRDVLRKACSLDLAFYEDPTFYDSLQRARDESRGTPISLLTSMNDIVRGGIVFVSMGSLVATFSIPLFGAMLVICLPVLAAGMIYGRKTYELRQNLTEENRRAAYLAGLMTTREYRSEALCNDLSRFLLATWSNVSAEVLGRVKKLAYRQHLGEGGTGWLMTAGTIGATAYVVCAGVLGSQQLSIGEVVMYSGAFAGGLGGLRQGLSRLTDVYRDALFLKNLLEYHRLEPSVEVRGGRNSVPDVIDSMELRNVSFRYPGSSRWAVRDVNVIFTRSKGALILGPNGAGKSTLIKLLVRLYDPSSGQILVNGVDIRTFDPVAYRKAVGVIFQDFACYCLSVAENIGFGQVESLGNRDRVIAAATRAKANQLIERLPRKYDTILGRLFKGGTELSRGQWQKISLARFFMRDASVILLDEPTASLDVDAEANLLQEIDRLSHQRIRIFISHRVFRPAIADQIIVLNRGEIVESGEYESLMAHRGEFSRLRELYLRLHRMPSGRESPAAEIR
jgi:ATP-binding cassette subfamily B protein